MQQGAAVAQMGGLQLLDGLDDEGGQQVDLLVMPARAFRAFSSAAEEAPSSAVVLPVTMLPSGSWMAAAGRPVSSARSRPGPPRPGPPRSPRLVHQQLQLVHHLVVGAALAALAQSGVVPADDLLLGGLAAGLVIHMQLPAMFTPMSVGER